MKMFSTIKVDYSRGIYGCSGEYFFSILVDGDKMDCLKFSGMYGADDRINSALKVKGYSEHYISSDFGKMVREDYRRFIGEYEALEWIKANL